MDDFINQSKKDQFHYQLFLAKSPIQSQKWLNFSNQFETSPIDYFRIQSQILYHPEHKTRAFSQVRAIVLAYRLSNHLILLQKRFKEHLIGDKKQDIKQLEEEVRVCIQVYKTLFSVGYFTKSVQTFRVSFDNLLLYQHNPEIFVDIVFLLRSQNDSSLITEVKKKFNLARYDPHTPEFFLSQMKELCLKYPQDLKEEDFEVANHSSKLYQRIFNEEIFGKEDSKRALFVILFKIFQRKMEQNPLVRFRLLTFQYIKLNFLFDLVPALNQKQQYERIIDKMIPQLSNSQQTLKVFLDMEPGIFLEVELNRKRITNAQFQIYLVQQIKAILKFVEKKQISPTLNPFFLDKNKIFQLMKLINETTDDIKVYQYYSQMIEFQKYVYLSFTSSKWFIPLNLLVLMSSYAFEDLNIDIHHLIIKGITQMIHRLSKDDLPVWIEYKDGQIVETPVTRLQYVYAILCYLKQCHNQENNFFQFPQPMPVDFPSSILLLQLVNIRFHQFEPNQKQVEYYTTMFQECIKHNVYPKYKWFKEPAQYSHQKDEERLKEWQMIREIKDQQIRKIFYKVQNSRESTRIKSNEFKYKNINIVNIINELKYNIGLNINNTSLMMSQKKSDATFMIVGLMNSVLHNAKFDFNSPNDILKINHLHLFYQSSKNHSLQNRDNSYEKQIIQNIVIPALKSDIKTIKNVFTTFPMFWNQDLCSYYVFEIVFQMYQYIMQVYQTTSQSQIIQKLLLVAHIVRWEINEAKRNQIEQQQQELASLITSVLDPSSPTNLQFYLSLLLLCVSQQVQAFTLIFQQKAITQNWVNYLKKLIEKKNYSQITIKQMKQTIEKLESETKIFFIYRLPLVSLTLFTVQTIFELQKTSFISLYQIQQSQLTLLTESDLQHYDLPKLLFALAILFRLRNNMQLRNIIKEISLREVQQTQKIKLLSLSNYKFQKELFEVNVLKNYICDNYYAEKQDYNMINGFLKNLLHTIDDISYFSFIRQLGLPLLPNNYSIQTILRIGSDNKYLFSSFVLIVQQQAKRPNIIQQTISALRKLIKQNLKLNVGAVFFLTMVVSNCRNKEIENFIFKNLLECHIFKVNPKNQLCKSLVTNTLKLFTIIMMQRAKILIKKSPINLFKLTSKQRQQNSESIDELFGILHSLPEQCLKQIKLVKQQMTKQVEQEWQSQQEESGKKKDKKKKKKNSIEVDVQEQDQLEDQNEIDPQPSHHDQSDSYYTQEEFIKDQEQISIILLNKENGFIQYNQYIKIRQELDIAIQGDYKKLEQQVNNDKNSISDQIKKYLNAIIARLSLLQSAQKRIITKMNNNLYNVLRVFGLQEERGVNEDDIQVQKSFQLRWSKDESQYEDDRSDDDDDNNDDGDGDQNYEEIQEQNDSDQVADQLMNIVQGNNQDVETFNFQIDNNGVFNIYVSQNEGQQIDLSQNPPSDEQFTSESIINTHLHKKQSSLEPHKVQTFKHQAFTSVEMDKVTEILIYKMFEFSVEKFQIYQSFYRKYASHSTTGSFFINSIMLLLRIQEQKDFTISKLFPIIDEQSRFPNEVFSNHQLFCRNAVNLLEVIDFSQQSMEYDQTQPGIQIIELIADEYKITKQPHLISLAMLHYRNDNDDFFDDRKVIQNMCLKGITKKDYMDIKTKHIAELVKSSFENECILMAVPDIMQFVYARVIDFIRAYTTQVSVLLLNKVNKMHHRLGEVQQQLFTGEDNHIIQQIQPKIILMLQITNTCIEEWNIYYYSIKGMIEIIFKTHKKKHQNISALVIDQIFTNKALIQSTTIILHHLNFIHKYLIKSGQKPTPTIQRLMHNMIKAPDLLFMLHQAINKQLNVHEYPLVQVYLTSFLFNPYAFQFGNITQVINLIFPLLELDMFIKEKYQKSILPKVYDNPTLGYFLPLQFRLVSIDDDNKTSQALNISRECSFDIAFHELTQSTFQIQYGDEEGNDQGGLKRQFMRGWTGKGISEEFYFIGRILGIAFRDQNLYGGTLDLAMTTALTGYKPDLKLMEDVDPIIYKNLLWIRENSAENLGLTFTRNRDYYGIEITQELEQDGSNREVTNSNKQEYIKLYVKNFLFAGRQQEMDDLKRGFFSVVAHQYVAVFRPQQLLIKLAGIDTIDIGQLKKNVTYQGYSEFSEVIKWFWKLVESFTKQQKDTFLHFLTGTHKIPLGLKNYNLTIERVHDITRLPVAHTCFNTLDLPEYTTESVFVEKLKTAIFEGHDTYGIM